LNKTGLRAKKAFQTLLDDEPVLWFISIPGSLKGVEYFQKPDKTP
jgi:hypothetical protein